MLQVIVVLAVKDNTPILINIGVKLYFKNENKAVPFCINYLKFT